MFKISVHRSKGYMCRRGGGGGVPLHTAEKGQNSLYFLQVPVCVCLYTFATDLALPSL